MGHQLDHGFEAGPGGFCVRVLVQVGPFALEQRIQQWNVIKNFVFATGFFISRALERIKHEETLDQQFGETHNGVALALANA